MSIAPGVYSEILDKSDFLPTGLSAGFFGLFPIAAKRGEDNRLKLTANLPTALASFKEPNLDRYGYSYYFADRWLKGGSSAYLCRLLPDDATYSNVLLMIEDDSASIPSNNPLFRFEFSQEESYLQDELVFHEEKLYRANTTVDADQPFNPVQWDEVSLKPYSVKETFTIGQHVLTANGSIYKLLQAYSQNIPAPKGPTNAYWEVILYNVGIEELFKTEVKSSTTFTRKDKIFEDAEESVISFRPIGRGVDYDKLAITITLNRSLADTYAFKVYDINVYDRDDAGSMFQLDGTISVSLDPSATDLAGESMFIEHRLARYSSVLRCKVDTEKLENIVLTPISQTDPDIDIEDIYTYDLLNIGTGITAEFANGSDGSLLNSSKRLDLDVFNGLVTDFYKGLIDPRITNVKEVQAKVIFDANYPAPVVVAMNTFVTSTRPDIFAYIGTGFNANEEQVLDARSGDLSFNNRNMSIKAGFYEVFDEYAGKYIKAPALLEQAYNISNSWLVNGVHVPVAGYSSRAQVSGIKADSLAFNPDKLYLDQFYLNQINPLIKDPSGYYMMGTLTTQRKQSAMSNESIVNMIQVMDVELSLFCERFMFDFITPSLLARINNQVNDYFVKWYENEGVKSVNVSVSASELDEKNKQVRVTVEIVPTSFLEKILLTFIVK